ncbi:MAG: D-2-hydroxyacid dehydrogenase [Woeseiaceae bacterium]
MKKIACTFGYLSVLAGFSLAVTADGADAQGAGPAATELIARLSLRESAEPVREHPRWSRPRIVAVAYYPGLVASEAEFKARIEAVAGDAEVMLFEPDQTAPDSIADADVFMGYCSPRIVRQLPRLRWIHTYSVGVDRCLLNEEVRERDFIMSNNQRVSGPSIAEHAIALMMTLSKNLHYYQAQQYRQHWMRDAGPGTDLSGKTMLVLGLGGIGTETARRASALGMRVIATRNSSREGPDFVAKVGLSEEMHEFAGEADVVVNALPLTQKTKGLIDKSFFEALRPGAFYINVGRGGTTVTGDLIAALDDGTLGGAGLDVMDPEPLPADHPLWVTKNVLITPHVAGHNVDSARRTLIIALENLRRYVQGEKLLNVVDRQRGY